jgi:DNA-binding HxlR family transcriptional regulator
LRGNGPLRRKDILARIRTHPVAHEWSDKRDVDLKDTILGRTLKKMSAEGLLLRQRRTGVFPAETYYSLTPEALGCPAGPLLILQ